MPKPEPKTDWTVWTQPEVAIKFANDRRAGIMGAEDQLTILRQLLPKRDPQSREVWALDMGCGDGILLDTVFSRWQGAKGIALDGSEPMLELAKKRFSKSQNADVVFVHTDFNDANWRDNLPVRSFSAVVSGFAIHHSEDERKREIYAEVFGMLEPGGVFVNIEHVASATPFGEELFEFAYAQNITRKRQAEGRNVTFEETLEEVTLRLDKSANRLVPVATQTQWLSDIGYTDVDCYWKHYELAIIAGYKPLSLTP